MPDLNSPIIYRNFTVHDPGTRDAIIPGPGLLTGIAGNVVDHIDISAVEWVQFMEKRSEDDGMDAGPVWASVRRISVTGTLYDLSRPLLMDRKAVFLAAVNPVLAKRQEPAELGFQPLYYSELTTRIGDGLYTPDGDDTFASIDLMIRARTARISMDDQLHQDGGLNDNPLAMPYQWNLLARDPVIYGASPVIQTLSGTDEGGTLINRGNYHVPFNLLFTCTSGPGVLQLTLGGAIATFTIPDAGDGPDRVVRVNGKERIVTIDGNLAMDVPDFPGAIVWPLVGSGPVDWSIAYTDLTLTGSDNRLWFEEGFA